MVVQVTRTIELIQQAAVIARMRAEWESADWASLQNRFNAARCTVNARRDQIGLLLHDAAIEAQRDQDQLEACREQLAALEGMIKRFEQSTGLRLEQEAKSTG